MNVAVPIGSVSVGGTLTASEGTVFLSDSTLRAAELKNAWLRTAVLILSLPRLRIRDSRERSVQNDRSRLFASQDKLSSLFLVIWRILREPERPSGSW